VQNESIFRQVVEVFHSGEGQHIRAPFLSLLRRNDRKPPHPAGTHRRWKYWKGVSLSSFAVDPQSALKNLYANEYHVQ
jgi:hypothetical protein